MTARESSKPQHRASRAEKEKTQKTTAIVTIELFLPIYLFTFFIRTKDITKTKLVNVVEKWLLILPSYFPSSNLLLLRLCVLFCRLLKAMVVSIENC